MSDEIDILMQNTDTETAKFTVNTAVTSVPLVLPTNGKLERADAKDVMQFKDHFQILSLGAVLPLSFEFYENDIAGDFRGTRLVFFAKNKSGGGNIALSPDTFWLPFGNYELNMGNYVKVPSGITDVNGYRLYLNFESGVGQNISMVGAPASLNAVEFRVPLFMKILHTLPMTS